MGNCCSKGSLKVSAAPVIEPVPAKTITSYVSFDAFLRNNAMPAIGGYSFIGELGKGATTKVYLVENIDKEQFAAKVYNKQQLMKPTLRSEESPLEAVNREIELMLNLDHPYIMGIIEAMEDDETNSIIIITTYASLGNVQSLIDKGHITHENILRCFYQAAMAFEFLHGINTVHRDIKPENLLAYTEEYYAVSDFSVSTVLSGPNQYLDDTKGSPAFMSPEECSGDAFLPKPADVWSYGVSLYSAVFKKLPFELDACQTQSVANTMLVVTQQLETQELTFPENADPQLVDLLSRILVKDPLKRLTFSEILQHPVFNDAKKAEEEMEREAQLNENVGK